MTITHHRPRPRWLLLGLVAAVLALASCADDTPQAQTEAGDANNTSEAGDGDGDGDEGGHGASDDSDDSDQPSGDEPSDDEPDDSGELDDTTTTSLRQPPEPARPASWPSVDFGNFTHRLDGDDLAVVDGTFRRGDIGDENFIDFSVHSPIYADIGGEEGEEAIVPVYWYTSGNGSFSDLLIYGLVDGEPELLDRAGVGDRALGGIVRASADGDLLTVTRAHGDAACCADRWIVTTHRLEGASLVEVAEPVELGLMHLPDPGTVAPEIMFLPGTSAAVLLGPAEGEFAVFEARAGQRTSLILSNRGGLAGPQTIELVDQASGDVIATVTTGATQNVELPTSGFYTLRSGSTEPIQIELQLHIR